MEGVDVLVPAIVFKRPRLFSEGLRSQVVGRSLFFRRLLVGDCGALRCSNSYGAKQTLASGPNTPSEHIGAPRSAAWWPHHGRRYRCSRNDAKKSERIRVGLEDGGGSIYRSYRFEVEAKLRNSDPQGTLVG